MSNRRIKVSGVQIFEWLRSDCLFQNFDHLFHFSPSIIFSWNNLRAKLSDFHPIVLTALLAGVGGERNNQPWLQIVGLSTRHAVSDIFIPGVQPLVDVFHRNAIPNAC
jgi:hypothetical protein